MNKTMGKLIDNMITHPTIFIFLLGQIPATVTVSYKLLQSYHYGVSYTEVDESMRQSELFLKNINCITQQPTVIRKGNGGEIQVWPCEEEDILIRTIPPAGKGIERAVWIQFYLSDRKKSSYFPTQSYASTQNRPKAKPIREICRVKRGRYYMRKIFYNDRSYWWEIIDIYTRQVRYERTDSSDCERR